MNETVEAVKAAATEAGQKAVEAVAKQAPKSKPVLVIAGSAVAVIAAVVGIKKVVDHFTGNADGKAKKTPSNAG